MGDSAPHLQQMPGTLRSADAGPRERSRLRRIEALAARVAGLEGPVRAVLEGRLKALLQDPSPRTPDGGPPPPGPVAPASALAGLTRLLAELHTRAGASPTGQRPHAPEPVFKGDLPSAVIDAAPLPALEAARQTWARLRMDDHLRHVMAEVPDDAGPMHSTVLVHRAIAVMHEAAPDYLQHFLGYADALAALERLNPPPTPAPPPRPARPRTATGAPATGKASRPRSRSRRRPA